MRLWFDTFEACLRGETAPLDLIGAGTATRDRAMAHYRFQHEAKVREAIEETFPVLLRHLGVTWDRVWHSFWGRNTVSPRNLDEFSAVFLEFYQNTDAPLTLRELARFEYVLEVHPWRHRSLGLKEFPLSEESRVILGAHEIVSFQAPVTLLYGEEEVPETRAQNVLIWQKPDGVYYRAMESWELEVLGRLSEGVEAALVSAPEDPEVVAGFFQWLGSSHLIQGIVQDSRFISAEKTGLPFRTP